MRGPRRPGTVPLDRALSKLGFASRAEAQTLIREGRVTVDGRQVVDPARAVVPETHHDQDRRRGARARRRPIDRVSQTARRRHDAPRSRRPKDGVRCAGPRRRRAHRRRPARHGLDRTPAADERHAVGESAHGSGVTHPAHLRRHRPRPVGAGLGITARGWNRRPWRARAGTTLGRPRDDQEGVGPRVSRDGRVDRGQEPRDPPTVRGGRPRGHAPASRRVRAVSNSAICSPAPGGTRAERLARRAAWTGRERPGAYWPRA